MLKKRQIDLIPKSGKSAYEKGSMVPPYFQNNGNPLRPAPFSRFSVTFFKTTSLTQWHSAQSNQGVSSALSVLLMRPAFAWGAARGVRAGARSRRRRREFRRRRRRRGPRPLSDAPPAAGRGASASAGGVRARGCPTARGRPAEWWRAPWQLMRCWQLAEALCNWRQRWGYCPHCQHGIADGTAA